MRPVPADSTETLGEWLARNGQTKGAINRFWRLVIASALNADVDEIALPYAAKVIRELFHELRRGRQHGHEHRAAERAVLGERTVSAFLQERGGEVVFNASVEGGGVG